MSFDWSEYLPAAIESTGRPVAVSQEAKLRSAISRAYYAAFGVARDFLESEGRTFSHQSVHMAVKNAFFTSRTDSARNQIGIDLDSLREDRVRADYKSTPVSKDLRATALLACAVAHEIIKAVRSLPKAPPRAPPPGTP